jgi:hypothetical protein
MEQIENLAKDTHKVISDYEQLVGGSMSADRIMKWINQFEEGDRIFILEELRPILDKRYLSKQRFTEYLEKVFRELSSHLSQTFSMKPKFFRSIRYHQDI